MRRAAALVALALLLGLGLFFASRSGASRDRVDASGEAADRAPAPEERAPEPASLPASEGLVERTPVAAEAVADEDTAGAAPSGSQPAPHVVRVLVTDIAGQPLEGAHVRLAEGPQEDDEAAMRVTGPDGACTLELVSSYWISLRVEREGFFHAYQRFELEKELRVPLAHAITLTGRVLDARSLRPVPGATVEYGHASCDSNCEPASVVADEQGRYELTGVPSSTGFDSPLFVLEAPGYARQWVRFSTETEAARLEHDFVLEGGIAVSGRVLDLLTREPLDATIGAGAEYHSTDEAGRFEGRVLPDPRDPGITLRVTAEEHCPMIVSFTREEAGGPLVVLLPPGAALEGTVRDPAGRPIAGARIAVSQRREERPREGISAAPELGLPLNHRFDVNEETQSAQSDRDGRFRVSGLIPLWDAFLFAACQGYREQRSSLAPGGAGKTTRLDLTLEAIGAVAKIRGRLTLNGEPCRATVQWQGPSRSGYAWARGDRYELLDVEPGAVALRVRLDGNALVDGEVELQVNAGDELVHDFELHLAMANISGRVRNAEGSPASRITVTCFGSKNRFQSKTESAADGSYAFDVPEIGAAYLLSVWSCNELQRREGVLPGATGVDFVLPATGVLRYRVVDAETKARLAEHVLAWRRPGEPAFRRTMIGLADGDGWQEACFPLGPVELLVRADTLGYQLSLVRDVVVSPTPGEGRTFPLRRGIDLRASLDPRAGLLPPEHTLLLLEDGAWEGVRPRADGRGIQDYGERYDSWTIRQRTLAFDVAGEGGAVTLRGLAPGRHRFKVIPEDVLIEPAEVVLAGASADPLVIAWKWR